MFQALADPARRHMVERLSCGPASVSQLAGSPGEGWESSIECFEFQVGGIALSRFGPKDGESYVNETRYLDIVRDQRIVSAGGMTSSGQRLFVGLLTVEFSPEGTGCRLLITEQGAFLDGHD
ncbi:MAG: polyketide cyclase, partial [Mesorhizobium sp.]